VAFTDIGNNRFFSAFAAQHKWGLAKMGTPLNLTLRKYHFLEIQNIKLMESAPIYGG
jgi:hypothetical protein